MASVLIVEDDRVSAEEMSSIVRAAGHVVVGVTISGEQALTMAERLEPDLALVDVKLRGSTDGIDIADRLQSGLDVAVVYVTGQADERSLERATRTAAYGYVLKPVDERALQAACSMALARHARDRAGRERRRAERLESLATLCAGIAHDFNNMLAIMHNSAALAKQAATGNERVQELLSHFEHAGERASALTAQLVSFARGGAPIRRPSVLAPLVERSVAAALLGAGTTERLELDADLWPGLIDEAQVSQVFTNLALNARQAMHDVGTIEVRGHNRVVKDGDPVLLPGRYVELSVTDTGPGIPPEDLDHLFDPFFSTREGGTGLGLASAYSIIKRHGGAIRVESTLGRGATFRIWLPATLPAAEAEAVPPKRQSNPPLGTGRILVLDDEGELRRVLAMCLEELGYDVEQAATVAEAETLYDQALRGGRRFDLAILDLTIRGSEGGLAALQRLKKLDPSVVAVATSGYSDSPVLAHHERYGFAGALPKPYRFGLLVTVLREASRRTPVAERSA